MYNNDELAIIFKRTIRHDLVELIPTKVVEGTYNIEKEMFIDSDGNAYYHAIENKGQYCFLDNQNKENIIEKNDYKSLKKIKRNMLLSIKKFKYYFVDETENEKKIKIIIIKNKKSYDTKPLVDTYILNYYEKHYPKFYDELLEIQEKIAKHNPIEYKNETSSELNIESMYEELTSSVINQDEAIKKILIAIWKQYGGFSSNKSRNILINGSTGVGKTEIIRTLDSILKVPHYVTSATSYSGAGYVGSSVEDMLIGLLLNANKDLESAQKGILIIDEIDKIAESSNKNPHVNKRDVQEGILKILEDGMFPIKVDNKEYMFNTKSLMVIGIGSWSRIELENKKPIGFEQKREKKEYKDITREDMVENGMIEELIGRFPIIVQMNELDYDSLLKILNSKNSILKMNIEFFKKRNIILNFNEEALKAIALKASKQQYGARSLDEIIETSLSIASFEIAQKPEEYEELQITEETIKDNQKYTLVRRKTKQ